MTSKELEIIFNYFFTHLVTADLTMYLTNYKPPLVFNIIFCVIGILNIIFTTINLIKNRKKKSR